MNSAPQLSSLSIFFPAYNEEENITRTINDALSSAGKFTSDYEVIVVNDGSVDQTKNLVKKIASRNVHVRLHNHTHNKGYGAAIKTGLDACTKDWIFFTDSDGQFHFDELDKFVTHKDDADLIIGYRENRQDPMHRIIIAKYLLRFWNYVLFGISPRDVDCAYKLFKRSVYKSISLITESAITETEFLVRATRGGYSYLELPVHHYPRLYGKQTGGNAKVIIKALRESIALWSSLHQS